MGARSPRPTHRRARRPASILLAALTALAAAAGGCSDEPASTATLSFIFPEPDSTVSDLDDADTRREGIQADVRVSVRGFDDRGSATLEVVGDRTSLEQIAVSGDSAYLFPAFDLPDGEIQLRAQLLGRHGHIRAATTIDVSVVRQVPPAPSLTFLAPADDEVVLTQADDADADPFDGFQYDVVVGTTDVTDGTEITLRAAGNLLGTAQVVAEQAVFTEVALPVTGPEGLLELVATATIDGEDIEGRRTVTVDIPCAVELDPSPSEEECRFTAENPDLDPEAPGFQTELTVRSNCVLVILTVNGASRTGFTDEGAATFEVDLVEGSNAVRADVTETSPPRTASTGDVVYVVDTSPPVLSVDSPEPDQLITPTDDLDGDPENGIQIQVAGSVEGVDPDTEVEIRLDGTLAATGAVDDVGAFTSDDVTLTTSGTHELTVSVADTCGNEGSVGPFEIEVQTGQPGLAIEFPPSNHAFLADGDPDGGDYETAFLVDASLVRPETEIAIRCFRPGSGLIREFGRAARGTDDPSEIPVTLPNGSWTCWAVATQDDAAITSSRVSFIVDNIAPVVTITEPEDGSSTRLEQVTLAAFVSQIDAEGTVVYTVGDDPAETPLPLEDGGVVAEVTLLTAPESQPNQLTVIARDSSGNETADSVDVTYDTVAPTLTFIAPEGATATVDAGDTRLHDLYLYDVLVAADEVGNDRQVCLTVNSSAEVCVEAVLVDSGWQATFEDTFILPGDNDLDVRATDAAGNEGTAHQDLTFDSTLPRLEIFKGVAGDTPYEPLDGTILGGDGLVDVHIATANVTSGDVQLVLNGVPAGTTAPAALVIIEDVLLTDENDPGLSSQDGWNLLQAQLSTNANHRSPPVRVRLDNTIPTVAFRDLDATDEITLAGGWIDVSPAAGFQADIAIDLGGIEAGQPVTLTVDCADDAFDEIYTETAEGTAVVPRVDLPGESTCTLTAEASDRAGNEAVPAVSEVVVDVLPPVVTFSSPEDGQYISFPDDVAIAPGIQIDMQVVVEGGSGDLEVTNELGTFGDADPYPLLEAIGAGGVVDLPRVTVPDGDYWVRAAATDAVGNLGEAVIRITVVSQAVTLNFFGLGDGDTLLADPSCTPGYTGDIQVFANADYTGATAYLCRRVAFGPSDPLPPATQCGDPQYEDIASAVVVGTNATFRDVSLDDGDQTLMAEMALGDSRIVTAPIALHVDTVCPTLESWALTNDTGVTIPDGTLMGDGDFILNATEAPDQRAQVTVTFAGLGGDRPVKIFSDPDTTPVASGTTTGDTFTFTSAALAERVHHLRAEVRDVSGNPLPPDAATLDLEVDVTPPRVSWVRPSPGGKILAVDDLDGDPTNDAQYQIDLLTSLMGIKVFVTGPVGYETTPLELDVGEDGHARSATTIDQDVVTLSATALDPAINMQTATAIVTVDVRPPTIELILPDPIEDADPAEPGFQLDVTARTTYAENGRLVTVTSDQAGTVGSGTLSGVTAPEVPADLVVRLDLPVGPHALTARVSDVNGNPAISDPPADVDIAVEGCGLLFTNPVGNPVFYDATGYTGNGLPRGAEGAEPKQVNVQLSVVDVDNCTLLTVYVRVGCPKATTIANQDAECLGVFEGQVDETGRATFSGAGGIEVFNDDRTTMHGIVVEGEGQDATIVGTTNQKQVIVDLDRPQVTLLRPDVAGGEDVLGLRLVATSADWSADGTTVIGPLRIDVVDGYGDTCASQDPLTRCVYTVEYSDGTPLMNGGGPLTNVLLPEDGQVDLTGVRYPSFDESAGIQLRIVVTDEVGNQNDPPELVPINVDADPPSAPATFSIDQSPYTGLGGERSGQADLSWDSSGDDHTDGGPVARYEIRAMCTQRTSRPLLPGGVSEPCSNANWSDIATWESRPLVASLSTAETTFALDAIGLDEDWTLGVRAFDEADNWSDVVSGSLSTRLHRAVIGNLPDFGTAPFGIVDVGDVNGDGRDDLLATYSGGALLMLGEPDPDGTPTIAGNPFELALPGADAVYFGSSASAAGDVNGDGIDDFVVGSGGFPIFDEQTFEIIDIVGDNRIYLYFGAADTADLVVHDVVIDGPPEGTIGLITGYALARSGSGNFVDLGAELGYDDFYFQTGDLFGTVDAVHIVLGREVWPASLSVAESDNCGQNVISIQAVNPPGDPPLATADFGRYAGLTTLNDDDWADLIASTFFPGNGEASVQYIFYGGQFTSCPTTLDDLADADEVIVNPDDSDLMFPFIGVHPTEIDDSGGVVARGLEYAVGLGGQRAVHVYRYDASLGEPGTVIYQTVAGSFGQFGEAVNFAGNFDQDSTGGYDLIIGASGGTKGRVYFAPSIDDDPRFNTAPDIWLDAPGSTLDFGTFVVAGFDFDGDGYPDAAAADLSTEDFTLFY